MFERRRADPEPTVLDTAYLGRLRALLGDSVLDELLEDGLIELTDRLTRLDELAAAGDHDGLARLGHDLVGMAGHLGLAALSLAAADMNRAARSGSAEAAQGGAARARVAGSAAEQALRRALGKDSGGKPPVGEHSLRGTSRGGESDG